MARFADQKAEGHCPQAYWNIRGRHWLASKSNINANQLNYIVTLSRCYVDQQIGPTLSS